MTASIRIHYRSSLIDILIISLADYDQFLEPSQLLKGAKNNCIVRYRLHTEGRVAVIIPDSSSDSQSIYHKRCCIVHCREEEK